MDKLISNKKHLTVGLLIILGVFFSGFFIGKANQSDKSKILNVTNKDPEGNVSVDFSPFWKAWNTINEKYIPTSTTTSEIDDQKRLYGAIAGMTKALGDPYTVFFPPVESKSFEEEISGNFEGVGMEIGIRDGVLTVVAPLKNTPAYRAGILSGDKIIQINNVSTNDLSTEEAVSMIRGKRGTEVEFTMLRDGEEEPIKIKVIRDVIDIPTIDTEIKGDVFIIRLYNFSAISQNLFRQALREFVESGRYKLVLDLRGNPGGYLEASIDMASWFLPPGKVVVKEDFKDISKNQSFRSKGYNIFNDSLKMVILIDGGSASASEILAGALNEHGVAKLIGTKSFGKGSVQELVKITDDTSLKITVARWLTPNGHSISDGGLTPDIEVALDIEAFKEGKDNQLEKALEYLKEF